MKKGFTLVELLVVIALIGLLIAIAVPSGIAISKKIKMKMLDTKIEIIENGAIEWGQNNKNKIKAGKNNCTIDEIKNDEKVSHCISIPLSYLLDKNALEEDKIIENRKVLMNPVTNEPLNNCSVEIYIKNKRVYAKYNINETNCGYEKVEKDIPIIKLKGKYNDEFELPSSIDVLEEIKINIKEDYNNPIELIYELQKNGHILGLIYALQNGQYVENFYNDLGCYYTDSNGNEIIDFKGICKRDYNYNQETHEIIFTYSYFPKELEDGTYEVAENYEFIKPVKRIVKVIDNSSPILLDIVEENEYDNRIIEVFNENPSITKVNNVEQNVGELFVSIDNYDGIGFYPLKDIDMVSTDSIKYVNLVDSFGNSRDYSLNFNYLEEENSAPIIKYNGKTEFLNRATLQYYNDGSLIYNYDDDNSFGDKSHFVTVENYDFSSNIEITDDDGIKKTEIKITENEDLRETIDLQVDNTNIGSSCQYGLCVYVGDRVKHTYWTLSIYAEDDDGESSSLEIHLFQSNASYYEWAIDRGDPPEDDCNGYCGPMITTTPIVTQPADGGYVDNKNPNPNHACPTPGC